MRMLPLLHYPHSIYSLSTVMVNLQCQFRIAEDTGKVYFLGTPDSVCLEIN